MGCAASGIGLGACRELDTNFQLGSKLGQGSFGEVRMLRSGANDEGRAVKVVPLHRSGSRSCESADEIAGDNLEMERSSSVDKDLLKQAHEEARIWRAIGRSEYCVELFVAFEKDLTYYMVMERCESSLHDAQKELSQLPDFRIADIFRQMVLGLSHLHRLRIAHRDVKPANFLLGGPSGEGVKLCDFGLATVVPRARLLLGCFGTAPYMSPEMVGDIGHDLSTDIWSLGVTVYELLFEELPYRPSERRASGNTDAVKKCILLGVPAPLYAARESRRKPSELATAFARTLLRRCVPKRRLAVQQVLHLPFLRRHPSSNL